jgi:uncharacterized membrane protein YcaP (DUF421 family)
MDVVLRASIAFFLLWILIRVSGKRQLGQMTPFEFVSLVVLGDLVQQGVTHNDYSLTGAALAVGTFVLWALLFGVVGLKSKRLRKLIDGEPRIVVRRGEIDVAMLKHEHVPIDELLSEMRLAGIAHVADVAWAILETNGKISFIKKDGTQPDKADEER